MNKKRCDQFKPNQNKTTKWQRHAWKTIYENAQWNWSQWLNIERNTLKNWIRQK